MITKAQWSSKGIDWRIGGHWLRGPGHTYDGCIVRLSRVTELIMSKCSSLMLWNLQLHNNSFEWKNVTFSGGKHALTPPTYFQGSGPEPPGSTPLVLEVVFRNRSDVSVVYCEGKESGIWYGAAGLLRYTNNVDRKLRMDCVAGQQNHRLLRLLAEARLPLDKEFNRQDCFPSHWISVGYESDLAAYPSVQDENGRWKCRTGIKRTNSQGWKVQDWETTVQGNC